MALKRYSVGLLVEGILEIDELNDPKEELGDIMSQIKAHTDLYWTEVYTDYVDELDNKGKLIRTQQVRPF